MWQVSTARVWSVITARMWPAVVWVKGSRLQVAFHYQRSLISLIFSSIIFLSLWATQLVNKITLHFISTYSHPHKQCSLCSLWEGDLQQCDRLPITLHTSYQVRWHHNYHCYYYYYYAYWSWRAVCCMQTVSELVIHWHRAEMSLLVSVCALSLQTRNIQHPTSHILPTVNIFHPDCKELFPNLVGGLFFFYISFTKFLYNMFRFLSSSFFLSYFLWIFIVFNCCFLFVFFQMQGPRKSVENSRDTCDGCSLRRLQI